VHGPIGDFMLSLPHREYPWCSPVVGIAGDVDGALVFDYTLPMLTHCDLSTAPAPPGMLSTVAELDHMCSRIDSSCDVIVTAGSPANPGRLSGLFDT